MKVPIILINILAISSLMIASDKDESKVEGLVQNKSSLVDSLLKDIKNIEASIDKMKMKYDQEEGDKTKKIFSDTLDDFINKPIKIYFSGYNNTFLGLNTKKDKMVANNKYIDFTNASFNPIAKLMREGSTYEIFLGGKRMCRSGGNVIVCTSKGGWSLERRPFGYTISKDNLCITKDSAEDVTLKTCVSTDDQIFDFKNVTDPNDCGAKDVLEEKDDHKINVNIIAPPEKHMKSKIKVKNLGATKEPVENDSFDKSSEYQDLYEVLSNK